VRPYLNGRSVLIGDLNTTPWADGLRNLDAALPVRRITRALPSWPALPFTGLELPFPVMPIDHIYIDPDFQVVDVTRGEAFGSDHYPVFARIGI
jgi:endonuclease/exonuclease/phosphatase (EEP) superfamily protein YafD